MNLNSYSSTGIRFRIITGITLFLVLPIVHLYGESVGMHQWQLYCVLENDEHLPAGKSVTNQAEDFLIEGAGYQITTYRQSYFKLNSSGAIELKDNMPFRSEGTYQIERKIHPGKTAIVIMDPWVDWASNNLNEYFGQITENRIMPLVNKALDRGHPVIVLTNNPAKVEYNTKIHPELATLESKEKINVLYHQDMDDEGFAAYLHGEGIDALIYTGFASNMCVIGREMGMITMLRHRFRLFFVPQASAAIEYPETWDNQSIHDATTRIISQWIAEIIDYEKFMNATETM